MCGLSPQEQAAILKTLTGAQESATAAVFARREAEAKLAAFHARDELDRTRTLEAAADRAALLIQVIARENWQDLRLGGIPCTPSNAPRLIDAIRRAVLGEP